MRTIQSSLLKPHLKLFFKHLSREDLSNLTVRGYQYDLNIFNQWLAEFLGRRTNLTKLSRMDLVAYRQQMLNVQRLKAATVNRRLEAVRKFLKWAIRQKIIKNSLILEVKSVKTARNRKPQSLTDNEVHALLKAAGETRQGLAKRNYAIVQLMIQAGLRVSEVSALRLADIQLQKRSGTLRVQQGKGGKQREIPLNATARRAIHSYLNANDDKNKSEPLFVSAEGTTLSVRAIQTMMSTLVRRAKVKRIKVSPHTLRHTFAISYLKQNQGKIVELATLLGHDSLDTTAIYTRPSREDLAEDLERSRLNIY